uniref:Ubiquitin carboxyl-terminal hydrolase n=1 Tax=Oryctolagus cuniculus TaxID=9986 RepID=A0A5F9CZI2_RABIT
MEPRHPEHLAPDEARTAEAVTPTNPEVLPGPDEHCQAAEAKEAERAAGEKEPAEQALPPAQGEDNLESPPPEDSSSQPGPAHETSLEIETIGACSRPQELPPPPRARRPELDFYCVKWIPWKGERTPIITQSTNGPCPLLAIMNILFLQWKVKLPPQKEVITSEELMAHLGNCLLSIKPQEKSEGLQLNFQQNVDDAMTVLPRLATGLDVNVRFTGVSDFEYTPECSVFDLLGIPLYHGWLVDPQSPEAVSAVGKLSYNQLVEKVITCKHSSDPNLVTEGLIAEQFLEATAAQLTYHGLCELTAAAKEGELSVFFRNNHFSTMTKHKVKRARDWGIGEQSASGLCSPGQGLTQAEEDVAMVAKDPSVPWGWLPWRYLPHSLQAPCRLATVLSHTVLTQGLQLTKGPLAGLCEGREREAFYVLTASASVWKGRTAFPGTLGKPSSRVGELALHFQFSSLPVHPGGSRRWPECVGS